MQQSKTNRKRILALLLVLTMCLTLVPGYAFAEDDGITVVDDEPAIVEIPDDEPDVPAEPAGDDVPGDPDADVPVVPEPEDEPAVIPDDDDTDVPETDDGEDEPELLPLPDTVSDNETFAADNVSTYTLQIPSTLTVSAAGWNETSGISATGTLESGKKLTVTASSANSWALKSGDNSVGYKLATASTDTEATTSWEFTELSNTATTKTMGIIVDDYSSKPAGTYQDTVTFTAKVEDAKPAYYSKMTSCGSTQMDQVQVLKALGRGYTAYNSSLTAAQAWELAKYRATVDGKTTYVIMSSQDSGYDIHYALSTDASAQEHTSDLYDLVPGTGAADKNIYYIAQ